MWTAWTAFSVFPVEPQERNVREDADISRLQFTDISATCVLFFSDLTIAKGEIPVGVFP